MQKHLNKNAREKGFNSFKSTIFPIKNLDQIPTLEPATALATEPEVGTEPIPEAAT